MPYGRKVHIRFKRTGGINDFLDLCHEYGHAVQFLTNFDLGFYGENDIFTEIVSIFFELLSLEYMTTVDEFRCVAYSHRGKYFEDIAESSGFLVLEQDLLSLWEIEKEESKRPRISILDKEVQDSIVDGEDATMEELLNMNLSNEFIYCLGYIIAVELLENYRVNREWGLYLLKELMRIDQSLPREEYYQRILCLVTPNEHLDDYKRHIMTPTSGK